MSYFCSLNSQSGLPARAGGTRPPVVGNSPHISFEEVELFQQKTSIGTVWIHFLNSKSIFLVPQTTLSLIATITVTLLRNLSLTRMGHLISRQACEMHDFSEKCCPLRDPLLRPLVPDLSSSPSLHSEVVPILWGLDHVKAICSLLPIITSQWVLRFSILL